MNQPRNKKALAVILFSAVALSGCSTAESEEARKAAAASAREKARNDYLNSPAGQAETYRKLSERTKNLHKDQQKMRVP